MGTSPTFFTVTGTCFFFSSSVQGFRLSYSVFQRACPIDNWLLHLITHFNIISNPGYLKKDWGKKISQKKKNPSILPHFNNSQVIVYFNYLLKFTCTNQGAGDLVSIFLDMLGFYTPNFKVLLFGNSSKAYCIVERLYKNIEIHNVVFFFFFDVTGFYVNFFKSSIYSAFFRWPLIHLTDEEGVCHSK